MWVYSIQLSERVDAGTVEADWEDTFVSATVGARGTSQAGLVAVVTTVNRVPSFADFESMGYVSDVTEELELPGPSDPAWDPPYSFGGAGGTVEFLE